MQTDKAIILLGGKGTRLSALFPDRPKALVPVAGRPFLAWQLEWLFFRGINHALLAAGYMGSQIKDWISRQPFKNRISISIEPKPLGTGGAVKYALGRRKGAVLVLNGDSLLPNMDFGNMAASFASTGLSGLIAVTRIEDSGRYGSVRFDRDGIITGFEEKKQRGAGWINAGIYLLDASVFSAVRSETFISIENEIFPALAAKGRLAVFKSKPPLLDMGTPEGLRNMELYLARHADGIVGMRRFSSFHSHKPARQQNRQGQEIG